MNYYDFVETRPRLNLAKDDDVIAWLGE